MEYPIHLIPQPTYCLIQPNDWFSNRVLIRVTTDKDVLDPDTGKIKLSCIVPQSDHLRDFSTNLLGTFTEGDTAWQITGTKEARKYFHGSWQPGEKVRLPLFPDEFTFTTDYGYFFIAIADLEGTVFQSKIGNEPDFEVVCRVIHTPTRCNFWHFSVRWFTDQGDISPQSGNWIGRLLKTQVKTLIQQKARLNPPPDLAPVPIEIYTEKI